MILLDGPDQARGRRLPTPVIGELTLETKALSTNSTV